MTTPMEITEILVGAGEILRRYLIGEDRHTPEIMAEWTPLIERLMDRPGERLYHGLVGMPHWEASLALPDPWRHPVLEAYLWLCFYRAPDADLPAYVGLLTPSGRSYEQVIDGAAMLLTMTGGYPDGPNLPSITREIVETAPNLAGGYVPGQLADIQHSDNARAFAAACGECAPILAQLLLSQLDHRGT